MGGRCRDAELVWFARSQGDAVREIVGRKPATWRVIPAIVASPEFTST